MSPVESIFDGFADVAVTGSDARHQDLLSSFAFVFSGLLWFDPEHDLKEVSDVSQELDPAVENDGGNSTAIVHVQKNMFTCMSCDHKPTSKSREIVLF